MTWKTVSRRPTRLTGIVTRFAAAGILVLAALGFDAKAATPDQLNQLIDIPAGDLADSLERLAKQSGLELVFDADRLKGIHTAGAHGQMTAMQAVHELLRGTSLTLVEHPNGAILVTLPAESSPSPTGVSPTADDGHLSLPYSDDLQRWPRTSAPSPDGEPPSTRDAVLETIIVTGTHILGEPPIGSSLIVYTRTDMERSGSATLEQFGRDIPENYAGTDAVATVNSNGGIGLFEQGAVSNIFGGAGFNLKGLGPGATLTLLNGHRLAAGGLDGSIVDIANIPLSAIDRIEVLDDSASAIYGSDAVAGVVNIITRREFEGAETGLRYGHSTQGGATEYTASQVVGHDWWTGNALLNYEYDNQQGLDASQRSWIGPQGGPLSLVPANRRHSVYLTGRQSLGSDTSLSADVMYSDRRFESNGIPITPNALQDTLQSSTGRVSQTAATVSVDQRLLDEWNASITGNYSSIRQRSDSVLLGAGGAAMGGIGDTRLLANSDTRGVDVLFNGVLLDLSDTSVKMSFGGSFRSDTFDSDESNGAPSGLVSQRRDVASAYSELIVPFVGEPLPWARRFIVSAAYRYDHYEGFGSTTNPKIGWLWEPMRGLQFKGTAGTSFKAPLLSKLGAPITSYTALFPTAGVPNINTDALIISGGNPLLQPETANSLTLGADFAPGAIQGLTSSVNFFWLRFENRIQEQNILPQPIPSQPQLLFIYGTNPGGNVAQTYFRSPGFLGDSAGLGPAAVSLIVDNQFANTASTIERGLNASSRYHWSTGFGQFDVWFAGQYLLADLIRTAVYAQELAVANTIGEPPKFKARGGVNWTSDALLADLTLNYVNPYRNTLFTPSERINAWTTADLYLGYATESRTSPYLDNLQVGLSVQNLTDQKPPYLQIPGAYLAPGRSAIPYDGANASPVGRLISLQFKKRW
jgi:iron complex outermembrane recepter protein